MPVQLVINTGNLDDLPKKISKAGQLLIDKTESELDEYGALLVLSIDGKIPKREGSTAQSLKYQIFGRGTRSMELRLSIGASNRPKDLVTWLRFGTGIYGPHATPIVPKRKQFLKFQIGGKTIFTRSVRGMRGRDFIRESWDDTEAQRKAMVGRIGRLGLTMLGDSR